MWDTVFSHNPSCLAFHRCSINDSPPFIFPSCWISLSAALSCVIITNRKSVERLQPWCHYDQTSVAAGRCLCCSVSLSSQEGLEHFALRVHLFPSRNAHVQTLVLQLASPHLYGYLLGLNNSHWTILFLSYFHTLERRQNMLSFWSCDFVIWALGYTSFYTWKHFWPGLWIW